MLRLSRKNMLMSNPQLSVDLSRYHLFNDHSERFSRLRGTTTNTPTTIHHSCIQSVASPPPFPERLGGHHRALCQLSVVPLVLWLSVLVIDHVTDLPLYPDQIPADTAFNIRLISLVDPEFALTSPFYSNNSRNPQSLSLK